MTDEFVGEIRVFPYNFAPRGWAFCDGQVLPISQNTALFSLLGTTYGGNGQSTFALPDLRGRVPMHPGQGSGLSLRNLGETGGSDSVTLPLDQIPAHAHSMAAAQGDANNRTPGGQLPATGIGVGQYAPAAGATLTPLAPQALSPAGSGLPHNNMQPYVTFHFCIALQGIYPSF
jgi:microcystin-dependent protein